ncbi:MAG: (d)CMP kinase, partial [Acidobacteria bacterium]|nr:(d)CMP kinase [Acidobacteriota bacterium]
VALLALETATSLADAAALGAIAERADFRFETGAAGNRLWLNSKDVTEAIRSPEVTHATSIVSTHAIVRTHLVERQREQGVAGGVVMEGRDIGTVVFPDADLKIFLEASPEVRGQRRLKDQEAAEGTSAETVLQQISERDWRDQTREVSPLLPASDAVRIDTTRLTAAEVTERILDIAKARSRGAGMENSRGNR